MKFKAILSLSLLTVFLIQTTLATPQKASNDHTTQNRALQTSGANISPSVAKINQSVDQRNIEQPLFNMALATNDPAIKIAAIQGLGRIGGKQVPPLVAPLFNDNDIKVRRAVAFALGLSGDKKSTSPLWQQLESEKNEVVKREIYLALGNLGGVNFVKKMLAQLDIEKNIETKASVMQALTMAVIYIDSVSDQIDMRKSQTLVDFTGLLALLEKDDILSYRAAYFLSRIKNIQKRISPAQLQKFITLTKSVKNKRILARLIGHVTKRGHLANRRLLSWLIEQTNQSDISLVTEAIHAMASLTYIPQAKIQLGKLLLSTNPIVAQSSLQVLADSKLEGRDINKIFKQQLKSKNPAMVVAAMSGLINRQEREDMIWALQILAHRNSFVKIRFAKMIAEKDRQGFTNVLRSLAKDKDQRVSDYAHSVLDGTAGKQSEKLAKTVDYNSALNAAGKIVLLHTTVGDIKLKLNDQAIYTANNFLRLVRNGYYNNTFFSRVIGDFVAQGGDHIGDVEGVSGQMIREEISYLSHKTGSVGIATSGKDTGDSQFFINLNHNIHLDRKYTIFADVIEGMDVVYRLSNGDQIINAEILE